MQGEVKHSASRAELDPKSAKDRRIEIPVGYRPGALCPHCQRGTLDYDSLLNLVCPVCGQGQGGCFT